LKKILLFICTFLVLLGLTACQGQVTPATTLVATSATLPTGKAATATPAPQGLAAQSDQLKGVQIFFMHPWTGDTATLMQTLVDEFNRGNSWGIQVNLITPGSAGSTMNDLYDRLQTSVAPDVVALPIDELISLNRNSQTVIDLTPYVNSTEVGFTQNDIENFSPLFWNQDEIDGYRYAIPAQRTAKVLFYNRTWAQELGFENPPSTPEEFQTQVCAAHAAMKTDTDVSNDGLGGYYVDTDAMTLASWGETFGADYVKNNAVHFNSSQMQEAFTYLHDLSTAGCAWWSTDHIAPYDYFAARKTLVYSADLQDILRQQKSMALAGSSDEWLIIPFPSKSEPFVLAQGPSYAILAQATNKQLAAWLFIKWMSSADHSGVLVKTAATLPLGDALINYSIELGDSLPQWTQAVNLMQYTQLLPISADWPDAKMILEDAGGQLFSGTVTDEQVPALTQQMDDTLDELMGR
jgi:ABC-type glycerol-3-phosphate transport system substrate-binding protein